MQQSFNRITAHDQLIIGVHRSRGITQAREHRCGEVGSFIPHRRPRFDALPDPQYEIEYGSIFDFEPARIRSYSPSTVIAGKFQAVVALGLINGRMKDFYDRWAIPEATEIDPADLHAAMAATVERRNTPVPAETPKGLSAAFAENPAMARQWLTYAEGTDLKGVPLSTVVADIWSYLSAALDIN